MWLLVAVVAALIGWAIFAYNRLVGLKNQVANGWKQIDVQLKRRHDLIPNLVSTVRGAMDFEQQTLERVISARNRAVAAPAGAASASAEADLGRALRQLFAVAENYPQLRANENVLKLQEELTTTENQLGFARQYYNDVATQFNTQQDIFPASLIAQHFGFQHVDLFAAADDDRAVPAVDLSLHAGK
jgi:LemA protein